MDGFMDMTGRGFILGFLGLFLLWKWLSKNAPDVTGVARDKAKTKLIDLIMRLFK